MAVKSSVSVASLSRSSRESLKRRNEPMETAVSLMVSIQNRNIESGKPLPFENKGKV